MRFTNNPQVDRIIIYLMSQYQLAKDVDDFDLAAYYWNGSRTVSLAQYL